MAFIDNFNYLIKKSGLSKRQFADKLGVHPSVVQTWTSGKSLPGADYLMRIKKVCHVHIDWLLSDNIATVICANNPPTIKSDAGPPPETGSDSIGINEDQDFKISDLMAKTTRILTSATIYKTALAHNINAFHQAVANTKEIDQRFVAIEDKMAGMEKENAELKRRIEMMQTGDENVSLPDQPQSTRDKMV